jgi:hypothetical protein
MGQMNQADLQRRMKLLIRNGRLPEAQAVLATIGYDLAELDRTEALLDGWINHQRQTEVLKRQQVEATATKAKAGGIAKIEVRKFKRVAEAVFKHNHPLLISLGLKPRRRATATTPEAAETGENTLPSDGDQAEATQAETATPELTRAPQPLSPGSQTTADRQTSKATFVSRSASAKMARWHKLFANALNLADNERTDLSEAGWPDSRLQASLGLVDGYIEADQVQHQCMRAFRAEEKLSVKSGQIARDWYERAVVLIDVAIEDADPDDRQQLRQLFSRR